MINRIMRAIRLDWTVFREIATDPKAMTEAAIIVVVVSLMSAIGSFIGAFVAQRGAGAAFGSLFYELLIGGILIGWLGWSVLTYFVGTRFFKGKTNIPEMLRVLGYASAPRLLGFLSFIPCVGWLIALAGAILSLIAGVLAIREAMEFDTGKAILTVVISWIVVIAITLVVGAVFGLGSMVF
jgi:hypothetical protein